MSKAKVRPEGLRMCLEDAEEVSREERRDSSPCGKEKGLESATQNAPRVLKDAGAQKRECEHNHTRMNLLRGRRP